MSDEIVNEMAVSNERDESVVDEDERVVDELVVDEHEQALDEVSVKWRWGGEVIDDLSLSLLPTRIAAAFFALWIILLLLFKFWSWLSEELHAGCISLT